MRGEVEDRTPVQRVLAAVHEADWVYYDDRHRRFYVLRGAAVTPFDTRTGDQLDASWPVDQTLIAQMGPVGAARAAVLERINRGY